jgi:hypothetical protein
MGGNASEKKKLFIGKHMVLLKIKIKSEEFCWVWGQLWSIFFSGDARLFLQLYTQ